MKIKFLTIILFSFLSAVNVTFQVDMQDETISGDGVYLVGAWQGDFIYTFHAMYVDEDQLASITIEINDNQIGESLQYWFTNGGDGTNSTWSFVEYVERFIDVPETETILDVVCFNSLNPCPEDIYFPVTLQLILKSVRRVTLKLEHS